MVLKMLRKLSGSGFVINSYSLEESSFTDLLFRATGVFSAGACATAEQAMYIEAHHRVYLHQNGASQSHRRDYFSRWSWRLCS